MTTRTVRSYRSTREDPARRRCSPVRALVSLIAMAIPILAGSSASAAVIPVTTLAQKISSSGGCSLPEAIFSANFDNNVAIAGYTGSTANVIVTQCVAGSGDDIIVL